MERSAISHSSVDERQTAGTLPFSAGGTLTIGGDFDLYLRLRKGRELLRLGVLEE
jgi:hypothetical protein